MTNKHQHFIVGALLGLSAILLYFGWREFWFLTDDAFIAFRYVGNSILGHGYTWNAPPFRPVEGYTSFLWVVLLEYVWRLFGVLPPKAANVLSLILSYGSLVLTVFAVLRMKLSKRIEKFRFMLLFLVLLGVLSNRTFLTWASSGLETALFNFLILLWLTVAVFGKERGPLWLVGLSGSASLVYLTRPDGILVALATCLLVLLSLVGRFKSRSLNLKWFLSILPLAIPIVHVLWRKSYYGEWLPNTYYAKHVAAWPEAGVRYMLSFLIEYGFWIWVVVLVIALVSAIRKYGGSCQSFLKDRLSDGVLPPDRWMCTVIAIGTVALQVAYYTLVIGGDHFEWRVYSHLIPLLFISFVYLLDSIELKPMWAVSALVLLIFFSYLIPWTHHRMTKGITHLAVADTLKEPVRDDLPQILAWLTGPHDALQSWLIDHHVCVRRQEHRLFCELQLTRYPDRTLDVPEHAGEYPVGFCPTVGVPGWVLPSVAIIDGYGLNDYIIARHMPSSSDGRERKMAHDRYPPEGYVESFLPNVKPSGLKQFQYFRRPAELELTEDRIVALEQYWEDKIVRGVDRAEKPGASASEANEL